MKKNFSASKTCLIVSSMLFIFFTQIKSNTQTLTTQNQVEANTTNEITTITPNQIPNKPNITLSSPGKKQNENNQKQEDKIRLNFENATLSSVVSYITNQLNRNYIPNKNLDGIPVSLSTQKALTTDQAWDVLLTLLDIKGFAINEIPLNENEKIWKIVSVQEIQTEPLTSYSSGDGVEPEDLPDNDTVIRYIYFLKNLNSETAATILDSMMDPNSIKINKDLEVCIITEKSYNIKTAMKIVKKLDEGGSKQTIKLLPLKNVDPETITKIFDEIIGQQETRGNIRFAAAEQKKQNAYFSPNAKIFPLARKNVLILMGTEENLDKIISFIQKYLDIPIGSAESRIHIKEIQYANAEKLKPILENILKPPRGQAAGKILVGEYKFFEDVIIAAESSQGSSTEDIRGKGNRLIIACNQDDWSRIDKFINKLDKPQPQIAMEIMIVDVAINKDRSLGAELRSKLQTDRSLGFELGKGAWGQTFNLTKEENLNTGYLGKKSGDVFVNQEGFPSFLTVKNGPADQKNDIWGIIKTKFNIDNSNIISQPFLIVNNYQECNLQNTYKKRVDGRILQTPTYSGNTTVETVDFNAETNIKITPYINLNGTVDLKIDIQVQDFVGAVGDQPSTVDRHLITRSTMSMGEVLVLGGLTKNELDETEYKTPILGDLPIVGNLFKNKSRTRDEKNLYIFIRPSIIKPQVDGGPDEYTQLKLDYAKYQILNVDSYYKEKDPIQRWFFKPSNQPVKAKLADAAKGVFRPIDDFTYGKEQPKSVDIKRDPYYRSHEEIEKQRKKIIPSNREKLKKRETNFQSPDIRSYLKKRQKTL